VQHFNVARSRIRKQCGLDGCNFGASGNITGLIRELNIAQDASPFAPQFAECISFSLSLQNKRGDTDEPYNRSPIAKAEFN
jgi:hypothetical protein